MSSTASYEIWLSDSRGNRIKQIDYVYAFAYGFDKRVPAGFQIVIPGVYDGTILPDDIIEFWRRAPGGKLSLENAYFVRRLKTYDDADGVDWLSVAGLDAKDLLRRRIIANYAGSAQAEMTAEADDMMKALVTDQLGADATTDYDGAAVTGRDLSGLNFTVQGDLSAAPSITRSFSWRNLLDVLTELADDSASQGTDLYFDVVPVVQSDASLGFQFRTYTDRIGQDHTEDSGSPVVFGRNWNNLATPSLEYDYTYEVNFVYAGGQGEETARNIQEVSDTTRIGVSPWNRCEGWADARNEETDAGVQARGRAELEQGKPVTTFDGVLLDTENSRYGRDWKFGDLVTIQYRGQEYDGMVSSVLVTVDENGLETVEGRVEI